jgi:ribosomal protein L28
MKFCQLCKKGSTPAGKRSFLRSHYNPTAQIRKYPNLQWAKLPSGKRAKICAKCLKTMHRA